MLWDFQKHFPNEFKNFFLSNFLFTKGLAMCFILIINFVHSIEVDDEEEAMNLDQALELN